MLLVKYLPKQLQVFVTILWTIKGSISVQLAYRLLCSLDFTVKSLGKLTNKKILLNNIIFGQLSSLCLAGYKMKLYVISKSDQCLVFWHLTTGSFSKYCKI